MEKLSTHRSGRSEVHLMALCSPIPSSLSVSNWHEYSKRRLAWELLDLGHKPEFGNIHFVKAKLVSVVRAMQVMLLN